MSNELIIDQGWFMGRVQGLQVVYMSGDVSDESYQRYVEATCKDIDDAPTTRKRGVFYDVPEPTSAGAPRRKAVGDALELRREKLRAITSGYVLATPSAIVRGMLTAVFWIAPPPYETKVVATSEEGFRWLAPRCPGLSADSALREYVALRERCLKQMPAGPAAAARAR